MKRKENSGDMLLLKLYRERYVKARLELFDLTLENYDLKTENENLMFVIVLCIISIIILGVSLMMVV